ncbi:MAG TPA: ABC transporter substrate-binding protein [Microthrixaceae bacterium]|nr:ABC transporter substrate-binding protein [Microthrixaceae bacterium]
MKRGSMRLVTVFAVVLALVAGACGEDEDAGTDTTTAVDIDVTTVGLWDDGPCDESLDPLIVGLQATFESPILTAVDQALALEASAVAFNARGGAKGHCIEVVTCDEEADPNEAVNCARTLDEAEVAVTINDGSIAPGPEVGDAHEAAGIARFATASGTPDLTDPNSYPIDAGGIGTTMVAPQGLVDQGVKKIASIRVDIPAAAALIGIYEDIYADDGVEFVADIPVPAGTTDYTQFILGAEKAGAEGVIIGLGGQEAIQVMRAAQQLGSDLLISASTGTFHYADVAGLGDLAEQMVLNGANVPATSDVPAVEVLRADLAASGEEALQPRNLKATPMRSWMGLYALLTIIRNAGTEDFSRANLTSLIKASGPIDMLDLTADWTPDTNNPGIFPRTGNGHYAFYKWDPESEFEGTDGNFVETSELNFNALVCGSPIGAPVETC